MPNKKFIPFIDGCGTPYFTSVLEIQIIKKKIQEDAPFVNVVVLPHQRVLVKDLKLFNFGISSYSSFILKA